MNRSVVRFLFHLLLLPIISSAQFTDREISRYKESAKRVTIIRDTWGVPHIYGRSDADAVFGLMYAQCEENFEKVEENTLEMLGRLAEIRGSGQILNDLQMRLIYDSAAAIRDYHQSPEWMKKLLDASADGINFFLYRNPKVKPRVLKRFEPWFSLMRTDGSISATQTGGATISDLRSLYEGNDATSYSESTKPLFLNEPSGSNGFAISPVKSATGNALLYINPHVTFYFRSEVHMVSDQGLNAYGAVTWSNFFIYQGFNEYCGWMHTSSYADVADLFMEQVERRENAYYYAFDGKMLPVKTRTISIRYLDGSILKEKAFTTYATQHGPVMGSRNGKWLSLRENNRSLDALLQSWLRTKAKGFEEFKKIMDLRANNSNNTVFADNKGNIAYWHGNFIPKRSASFDYGLPVDGSTSTTDWQGIHKLEEIVHVYNPASGWIQNCNSTPFTASGFSSPKSSDYPKYMAPDGENFRGVNAVRLMEQTGKLTMDGLIRDIGYSHYLSAFDVLLPPLIGAYDQLTPTDSRYQQLSDAITYLKRWDRNSSESSIPTTLAIEWAYRMLAKASPSGHPYNNTHALSMVSSMLNNTGPDEKLQLLLETINDLRLRFSTWKVGWGEVNRYQRTNGSGFDDARPSMPVGLAPATWGALPSFSSQRFTHTDRRYGVSGNSFVACVEFGKRIKAKSVITGGQSFNPDSRNFTDQAKRFIDGNFKDVLFYKEDVLKHVLKKYHPGE